MTEPLKKETVSMLMMACFFVLAQILALFLAIPSRSMGLQAFEDPEDPVNSLYYIFMLLILTGGILLIIKFKKEKAIKYLFLLVFFLILFTVFTIVLTKLAIELWNAGLDETSYWVQASAVYLLTLILPVALPIVLIYIMVKNPEWYVIDTIGLITAAGSTAIFGISLSILPILILLSALAIYDAISVYKTKHMVTLADSVVEFRLPVLLVVPKNEDYSFKKQAPLKEQIKKGEERAAMFMGLGDIVIPGSLIVSSFIFLPLQYTFGILSSFLVSMGTMAGALLGYCVLMYYVAKGNPQAGLPLLNSGAMGGYFLSYLLIYQDLTFGIVRWW